MRKKALFILCKLNFFPTSKCFSYFQIPFPPHFYCNVTEYSIRYLFLMSTHFCANKTRSTQKVNGWQLKSICRYIMSWHVSVAVLYFIQNIHKNLTSTLKRGMKWQRNTIRYFLFYLFIISCAFQLFNQNNNDKRHFFYWLKVEELFFLELFQLKKPFSSMPCHFYFSPIENVELRVNNFQHRSTPTKHIEWYRIRQKLIFKFGGELLIKVTSLT